MGGATLRVDLGARRWLANGWIAYLRLHLADIGRSVLRPYKIAEGVSGR
jgi:hypothetical protein